MREAQEKPEPKPVVAGAKPGCKATTRAGKPCQGRPEADGYCWVHSPTRPLDFAEIGRKGGLRSAAARRAPAGNGADDRREAREARAELRRLLEQHPAFQAMLRAVYEGGLEATLLNGMPDHRTRILAANSLLAEAYGKPMQSIEAKHDVNITVVSRTLAALEREDGQNQLPPGAADDVLDVEAEEVRELPPPEAG